MEAEEGQVAVRGKVSKSDERKGLERVGSAVPGVVVVDLDALILNTGLQPKPVVAQSGTGVESRFAGVGLRSSKCAEQAEAFRISLAVHSAIGSAIGAQAGANVTQFLCGEQLKIFLALVVLPMMGKMLPSLIFEPAILLCASAAHGCA